MACENIFRDVCVLHQRLFDHKPALQGHINYFIKEFEERRGQRENTRLEKTAENVTEVKDNILPTINQHLEEYITEIAAKITLAKEKCQTMSECEGQKENSLLPSQQKLRSEDWEIFMKQQCQKSAQVDEDHQSQVQALNQHYAELEQKLQAASKPVL